MKIHILHMHIRVCRSLCRHPPVWQAPPIHPSGQLQIPGSTQLPPFLHPCGQIAMETD